MFERLVFWFDLMGRGASTPFFGEVFAERE